MGLPLNTGKVKDVEKLDNDFFRISDSDAHNMDPQVRILHEVAYEALVDAGVLPESLKGSNTGVFTGLCYDDSEVALKEDEAKAPGFRTYAATRISCAFDFNGTALATDTACASSFTAFCKAVTAIRVGDCDAAIVAGVSVHLRPSIAAAFHNLQMLSDDGRSKCMDASADGYCRSEAVVAILLQKKQVAKRIYATVLNTRTNNDGFKAEGITFPSMAAQRRLMKETYAQAGVDPLDVKYMEAHMTGTPAGDPVESQAIMEALCENRKEPLLMGCLKSNMGHTEGASGMCAISKACLVLQNRQIPPNLHLKNPNPHIEGLKTGMLKPVLENTPFDGDLIGVNSFGFGGCNVHAVLKANEKNETPESYDIFTKGIPRLVVVCGRNEEGVRYIFDHIICNKEKTTREFLAILNEYAKSQPEHGMTTRGFLVLPEKNADPLSMSFSYVQEKRPLYLSLSGIGSFDHEVVRSLSKFDIFESSYKYCQEIVRQSGILVASGSNIETFAHVTSVHVAVIDLFKSLKVPVDGVLPYSYLGQVADLYFKSQVTAEQAVLLSLNAGHICEEYASEKGTIARVNLAVEEAVKTLPNGVEVVFNTRDSVVVSGPTAVIHEYLNGLLEKSVSSQVLQSSGLSLHSSSLLQPDSYSRLCSILSSVSNVSIANQLARSLTQKINLDDVLQVIPGNALIIDIGPDESLAQVWHKELGPDSSSVSLLHGQDSLVSFLSGVGALYLGGRIPCIEALYPKVNFPVARETASVSPLIKWVHSKDWHTPKFPNYYSINKSNQAYSIDIMESRYQYLTGHCIDGRVLFPATGYLWIVWERMAILRGFKSFADAGVEFTNVKLHRATMVNKSGLTTFKLITVPEFGHFAVLEGGAVCVTGHIRLLATPEEADTTHLENEVKAIENPDALTVYTKELYKEFRVRGYDYGPSFQGLVEAKSDGTSAKVKWMGNWVSFTDSMLQLAIIGAKKRGLMLPTFIELVKCDIKALYAEVTRNKNNMGESEAMVYFDKDINIGVSRGIVVKGLKASLAPRRQNAQTATVETYSFLPYHETTFVCDPDQAKIAEYTSFCGHLLNKIKDTSYVVPEAPEAIKHSLESHEKKYILLQVLSETLNESENSASLVDRLNDKLIKNAGNLSHDLVLSTPLQNEKLLRPQVDVILENTTSKKLIITEANTTNSLVYQHVAELMAASMIQVNYSLLHPKPEVASKFSSGLQVGSLRSIFPIAIQPDVIIYKDATTGFQIDSAVPEVTDFDIYAFLKSAFTSLKDGGFVLLFNRYTLSPLEELVYEARGVKKPHFADFDHVKKHAEEIGFTLISQRFDGVSCQSLLLRKSALKPDEERVVIPIKVNDYSWVDDIKAHLVEKKSNCRTVWLAAVDTASNGIVGLVNCLRKEAGGEKVRMIFCPPNEVEHEIPTSGEEQIQAIKKHLLTPEVLKRDLVMNVYRNGAYGSFRHFLVDNIESYHDTPYAYLDMKTKGDLSSLRWVEAEHKFWTTLPETHKDPTAIFCQIYASTLNFKDVMVATGRIPVDAYPVDYFGTGLIGMEFAGRTEAGERIFSFTATKCIATNIVIRNPYLLWKVPDHWSMAEAATVPIVYITVYYALFIRAQMRHGETVLIHAGSGGVGQAAINVCLSMGCKVYTTVGNQAKRDFLLNTFPQLSDSDIGNSRDISFEEHILKDTNGRGVDIVLNSLADEKLQASVRLLADFGRFVEIGKYDIMQNNPLNISDLGRNKTYHAVCVAHLEYDALVNKAPSAMGIIRQLKQLIQVGVDTGAIKPLQMHIFEKHQSEEAFRFMATGKHMGKVIIKIRDEEKELVCKAPPMTIKALKVTTFHPMKSYLITGGLGGFGLELADWLIRSGVSNLVLSSRSGAKTPFQQLAVRRFKDSGIKVVISNHDVSSISGAASLIQEAENLAPVGGIFHLAMVLKDAALENQTVSSYEEACASKVAGTLNLDKITRQSCHDLDYFVCFSSVTSGRGNAGQTNYGFANSVMERTCEVRRKDGLPGLAIQWGAIGDVGVVAESMGGNDIVIGGTLPQRIPSCMEVLNQFIQSDIVVCSSIVKADNKRSMLGGKGDLVRTVCHVLGVKDPATLDPNTTLGDLGLDSLMAVEIRQGLERDYDIVLSTQEVRALKIKDIQVIGQKSFKNKAAKKEIVGQGIDSGLNFNFELPSEMFVHLNPSPDNSGRPIFFIPPIEGDFKTILPLTKHILRPVIGINWTSELDSFEHTSEVAAHYVQKLRQTYPDDVYDLVGYSYGAVIAFEMSVQIQKLFGEKAVKKLVLLDGSPTYLKAFTMELGSKNSVLEEHEAHVEMLLGFTSMLYPIESSAQAKFKESLLKLPTKEDRTKSVADFITNTAGLAIESDILTANAERYFRKMKMVHLYEPSDKYTGDVKLLRATETGYSNALSVEVEEDYGLNKVSNCFLHSLHCSHHLFLLTDLYWTHRSRGHRRRPQVLYLKSRRKHRKHD